MFLRSKDSNTDIFLWIFLRTAFLQNTSTGCFCTYTLYFQFVNSSLTTWTRELFTWIDISCSFICSFIFLIFSSQVGILILIGSLRNIFSKFDQKKSVKFCCSHYTVKLFVALRIVYRIGFLFTLERNIWAHVLYRIAVETLRSRPSSHYTV